MGGISGNRANLTHNGAVFLGMERINAEWSGFAWIGANNCWMEHAEVMVRLVEY